MQLIKEVRERPTQTERKAIAWKYIDREDIEEVNTIATYDLRCMAEARIEGFKMLGHYQPAFEWFGCNHGQGLLLRGTIGSGKTMIVRDLLLPAIRESYNIYIDEYNSVGEAFRMLDNHILGNPKHGAAKALFIDDIGKEGIYRSYGNERNIIEEIVEDAYIYKKLLIFTTNLSRQAMAEKYDARVISRMQEMMKDVTVVSQDMRKEAAGWTR